MADFYTYLGCTRNPYRQSHVIVSRPGLNDRRIGLHEMRDWHTFTPPELALQADALDSPCAEIFGMPVVPYKHLFVGLVWVFHPEPAVDAANKYFSGKINCQLAYSRNGWHFQRTLREPFLANAESGQHGSGCIYPFSTGRVAALGSELPGGLHRLGRRLAGKQPAKRRVRIEGVIEVVRPALARVLRRVQRSACGSHL